MAVGQQVPVVERLCRAVEAGIAFDGKKMLAKGEAVHADDLRRLILGLPVGTRKPCALTPVGVEIVNARINGRLLLDKVALPDGGPAPPIELRKCFLEGGFSGTHGRFSRLCFTGSRFSGEPLDEGGRPVPTIDLSGAVIGRDLDMDDVGPKGAKPDAELNPNEGPYLWIRLTGARIGGHVALSRSFLRAPVEPPGRCMSDLPIDALSLSVAEVGGDVWFLHSTSDGTVSGRGLGLKGDIWMSGTRLRRPGGRGCLFLQAARIGGSLMLDGRDEHVDDNASFRPFVARGTINLVGAQVAGFVIIADVDILPGEPHPVTGDCVSLCMSGARIGISVEIGKRRLEMSRLGGRLVFDRVEIKGNLSLEHVRLGVPDPGPADRPTIDADGLVARAVTMKSVSPLSRGDSPHQWFAPKQQWLSISLKDATLGTLEVKASRFTGPFNAAPIRCTDDVYLHGRIGGEVDLAGAEIGGSLDIAGLRMDPTSRYFSVKGGTIGHALRLARPSKPGARSPSLRRARRTKLCSLPDTTLIETLWEYQDEDWRTRFHQSAFLERGGMYYLLDRRADVLGDFVRRHGHTVKDTKSAKEYFRIYCDYGPSEMACRWLVPGPHRLPPFAVAHEQQSTSGGRLAWPGDQIDDACLAAPLGGKAALQSLAASDFTLECEEAPASRQGRTFEITARLICGDLLARGRLRLSVGGRRLLHIRSMSGPERAVRLAQLPIADGQHLEHPPIAGSTDQWVTQPALEASSEIDVEQEEGLEERLSPYLSSGFSMQNRIDLSNLTCTTLEDRAGRLWGTRAKITMNHFTYRQAQWGPRTSESKRSHLLLRDRLLAFQAEWLWPFRKGFWADRLRERQDFWEPWQVRRNWIYQQYCEPPEEELAKPKRVTICRHRIEEEDYRPQPFEQAIRVARAEGREDFAINFEMLKQRIEWRLFNKWVRWWLGFLGIGLGALWLLGNYRDESGAFGLMQWLTILVLALTLALMIGASSIHSIIRKIMPWLPHFGSRLLTWVVFFIPPGVLFLAAGWWSHPFPFLVALLIFIVVRWLSYIAYLVMRFGFGYMRRPVRAVGTLIVAFLIGWLGVGAANDRGMLVINAEPVADLVQGDGSDGLIRIKNDPTVHGVHIVPCGPTISEPLYALDVLIPLIDLREESRCEVRRVADELPGSQAATAGAAAPQRPRPGPGDEPKPLTAMGFAELWDSLDEMTLENFRFWWLMKALYAIAGWFIVSLAILTFAQANRTHAEPPTERK